MQSPHMQSVVQIPEELGIHVATLCNWRKVWRLQGEVVPASEKEPRADSKSVICALAEAVSMGRGRRNRLLLVLKRVSAATDLDLISYLKAIPDARMRRGVRIPAWYLLLVAVLGILSRWAASLCEV